MTKPDFCICKNKGACQLCSNCLADQRLWFRFMDSTFLLLIISKLSTCFQSFCCDCPSRSGQKPKRTFFSHHITYITYQRMLISRQSPLQSYVYSLSVHQHCSSALSLFHHCGLTQDKETTPSHESHHAGIHTLHPAQQIQSLWKQDLCLRLQKPIVRLRAPGF